MRAVLLAAAAAAALSAAACNRTQTDTETTAVTPAADATATTAETTTVQVDPNAPPPMAAANTAAGFVGRAALSDMYEIESSRLALQRSQSQEVKRYAQMMIDAHTGTTRQVAEIIRTGNLQITSPASLDRAGSDRIADLRSASDADFDDRYIDQQTAAHQSTLALMRDYAGSGDNAALQAFARATAPTIEEHLRMVQALDASEADDAAGANAPTATTGPAAAARNDGDRDPTR